MTLLYRSIWSDDRTDTVTQAVDRFRTWVVAKGGPEVPTDGSASAVVAPRGPDDHDATRMDVRIEMGGPDHDEGIDEAARATLVELRPDGSRWTTTLRTWSGPACLAANDPRACARVWIDVQAVARNHLNGIIIRSPRLVRDLLAASAHPRRGAQPLAARVLSYSQHSGAEALADLITDLDRDLPVVVFTPLLIPPGGERELHPADMETAMHITATTIAGMATVCHLDGPAIDGLGDALGRSYSVWGGAFRIYLPGADPAIGDEWRHRVYLPDRYLRTTDTAARLVVRAVSPVALTRRVDDSYERARAVLRRRRDQDGETGELLRLTEQENERLGQEVEAATQLLNEQQTRYDDLIDDHDQLRGDLADLRERLDRATAALRDLGHAGADAPRWATYPSQAWDLAREYLGDHLSMPPQAAVDLEDIDSAREAGPWGQASWDAFRALHAYAAALAGPNRFSGTFWTWCETSGDPRAWRATSKKLAMTESETVKNKPRLAGRRLLPVDTAVDPGGRIHMFAHIKIAEGGGDLAPRIYFHVDEAHARVHVGYFGPHRNMPNTLT